MPTVTDDEQHVDMNAPTPNDSKAAPTLRKAGHQAVPSGGALEQHWHQVAVACQLWPSN
jgi:hypothetical protein